MRKVLLGMVLAACLGACIQPVYRQSDAPLTTTPIDIDRYLGHWREAARLPNRFERDCVDVTADYAREADGAISVRNTCRRSDGAVRIAEGRVRVVEPGKLKVLFGLFWGDYWVLECAEDYSWAIVGEPGGRYLWVLTRTERISAAQRSFFEERIRALGYRPGDLIWAA